MQLLCPECCSENVGPHPDPGSAHLCCANCGATFGREEAHITIAEAESRLSAPVPERLFELDADRARAELRDPDGALRAVGRGGGAEEVRRLLDDAQEENLIRAHRWGAAIGLHPVSAWPSHAVLAVDPGHGPTLLGPELELDSGQGEDPVDFTVRTLERIVEEADSLASGRAADSERLDRIAAFINANRPWNRGDVCEFLASEIVASGRRLLEAEE